MLRVHHLRSKQIRKSWDVEGPSVVVYSGEGGGKRWSPSGCRFDLVGFVFWSKVGLTEKKRDVFFVVPCWVQLPK